MDEILKCPLCHTDLNYARRKYYPNSKTGKCMCGTYVDAINENTWKEKEWLERHELWENGKLGFNVIYQRLDEIYKNYNNG